MAATGYTPISLYYSTTASAVPTAGNLVAGELAININDGKLYFKNSSNVVTLLAAASGASGDVVGPASATDNAVVRFDSTTGKLIKNSGVIIDNSNNVTGVVNFTNTGNTTLGDAAGDTLTITGTTVTTPNGLNFDSNTLVIDATNNRVGVGVASPSHPLNVVSSGNGVNSRFTNGSTIVDVIPTASTSFVGDSGGNNAIGFNTASNFVALYTNATTERMRLDSSGNLGLGVTPSSSWWGNLRVLQVGYGASLAGGNGLYATLMYLGANYYTDGTNNRYLQSDFASRYDQVSGTHKWFTAPSGTAGNAITFTQAMTLDASGNLGIGTSSPAGKFNVGGGRSFFGANSETYSIGVGYTQARCNSGQTYYIGATDSTTPDLVFSNSAGTERMRITSTGNVGIGTTNPGAALEIARAAPGGFGTGLILNDSGSSGAGEGLQIEWRSGTDKQSDQCRIGQISNATGSGSNLAFYTNSADTGTSTERMRITSGGLVGIGETTPANTLAIKASQATIRLDSSTGTSGVYGQFVNTAGSFYVGRDSSTGGIFGTAYASVLYSEGAYPMIFYTTGTERLRIDSSGNALFAKAVRATITTDNDLSFDMNAASNFKCTPTAGGALTFTNITSGQTGNIILVNNSNYAITAAATTKVSSTCLATISATGTYWLSYYSDGTNVYVANTGALA